MKLLQTNERNLKRNNMLSLGYRSSVGSSSVATKRFTGLGLLPDDDITINNLLSSSSKENRIVRVGGSSGAVIYSSPSSSTARLSNAASHISSSLRTRRHERQQSPRQYHLQPARIYVDSNTIHAIRAEVDDLPLPATLSSICLALQSSHAVLEAHADLYSRRREKKNDVGNDDDDMSMKRLEILGTFMSELNFEDPFEKSQHRRDEFKTACMSLATRGNNTKLMTTWEEVQVGLSDIFLFAKFDVNSTTGGTIGSGGILSSTPSHSSLRGSSNSWKDQLSAVATKPSVKRAHRSSPKMARPEPSPNKRTTTRPNPITPAVGNFLSIDSFRDQIMNRMGRAKFLRIFQQGEVRNIPYLDETTARLDAEIARRERERPSTIRADAIIVAKEKADREREARESAMKLMRPLTDAESDIVIAATEGIGPLSQILASQDADSVQRGSMQTLRPGQWLNDEVINYFLKNCLAKRDELICARQSGRKRSHFFNSFFVQTMFDEKNNNPSLRGRYNYKNVKRWSKKVPGKDIFNLKYILCPINLDNMHWTSAVIYMEEKRIQYYDSMGGTDRAKLKGLLEYVKDEYKVKNGGQEMDVSEWELVSCTSDTPRQRNGFDCGVFTCMFCDFISRDCALVFNQSHIDLCRDRIALSIMKNCAIE